MQLQSRPGKAENSNDTGCVRASRIMELCPMRAIYRTSGKKKKAREHGLAPIHQIAGTGTGTTRLALSTFSTLMHVRDRGARRSPPIRVPACRHSYHPRKNMVSRLLLQHGVSFPELPFLIVPFVLESQAGYLHLGGFSADGGGRGARELQATYKRPSPPQFHTLPRGRLSTRRM
jgi:hypothetical protein